MEHTRHNHLIGKSAEKLAAKVNLDVVDPSYFSTPKRREQLKRAKEMGDAIVNDHDYEDNDDDNHNDEIEDEDDIPLRDPDIELLNSYDIPAKIYENGSGNEYKNEYDNNNNNNNINNKNNNNISNNSNNYSINNHNNYNNDNNCGEFDDDLYISNLINENLKNMSNDSVSSGSIIPKDCPIRPIEYSIVHSVEHSLTHSLGHSLQHSLQPSSQPSLQYSIEHSMKHSVERSSDLSNSPTNLTETEDSDGGENDNKILPVISYHTQSVKDKPTEIIEKIIVTDLTEKKINHHYDQKSQKEKKIEMLKVKEKEKDFNFISHNYLEREREREKEKLLEAFYPGSTGTVGCVCMLHGHVAAATSTGGLTNKMAGRVGTYVTFL